MPDLQPLAHFEREKAARMFVQCTRYSGKTIRKILSFSPATFDVTTPMLWGGPGEGKGKSRFYFRGLVSRLCAPLPVWE